MERLLAFFGALVLSSSALLPHVPDPRSLPALLMVAACFFLVTLWVCLVALRAGRIRRSLSAGFLAVFLCVVLGSWIVAALSGTPLRLWFRGAIPFLFLVVFFPFVELARRRPTYLLDAVLLSCLIWLLKIAVTSGPAVPAVLRGDVARLTHAVQDWGSLGLPFSIVGLAVLLFSERPLARRLRWIVAPLFSVVPVLTLFRGQVIIVAALWVAYWVVNVRQSARHVLWTGLLLGVLLGGLFGGSDLKRLVANRFGDLPAEFHGPRVWEVQYAFGKFVGSPLWGRGLGYQIPAEIAYWGDIRRMLAEGVETVGYVHNVVAYLLMDLGLLGLWSFAGFILADWWRSRASRWGEWRAASLGVGALLAWFLVQPMFRFIQSHLLLAALLATLSGLSWRWRTVPVYSEPRGRDARA